MSKIIAIEAQRIFRSNKGGMDVVIIEIIRELQKMDQENQYFILVASGPDKCISETHNFRIIEIPGSFYPYWEQVVLCKTLAKLKPNLVHCTSNTAPLFWKGPLLLTLHDIIYLETSAGIQISPYQMMGRIYRRWLVPSLLRRKLPLITVSHNEKKIITQRFHIPEQSIHVVYNACSDHFFPRAITPEERQQRGMPERYFFVLGNTDPRKNVTGVLKAYALYREQSPKHIPLVMTGINRDTLKNYLKILHKNHLEADIILTGYMPWADLPWWYSGATASLYISLREGFGIPILESMACGTPVLTSSVSSMPEVAGPEGLLTDPRDPEAICTWLLRLERDEALRKQQKEYGLKRAGAFSWSKSATQVKSLYTELINHHASCE